MNLFRNISTGEELIDKLQKNNYYLERPFIDKSCSVVISSEYRQDLDLYTLSANSHPFPFLNDYFFNYYQFGQINQPAYIPRRLLTNGTTAITPLMNGCALEVRYDIRNDTYLFYHDNNGRQLSNVSSYEKVVCRITANNYYNDYWINDYMNQATEKNVYFCIQFICVYFSGSWYVGTTGIVLGLNNKPVGIFPPKNRKYKGYFNRDEELIQL